MTLGETDQAFGENITTVIDPLTPIQYKHYSLYKIHDGEMFNRNKRKGDSITKEGKNKKFCDNYRIRTWDESGTSNLGWSSFAAPPPCLMEAPFRLTRGCDRNAMTLRVSKY